MCIFSEREKTSVILIHMRLCGIACFSGYTQLAALGSCTLFIPLFRVSMVDGNGDSILFLIQWNQGDIQEDFLLCLLSAAHMDTFCHGLFYPK